MSDTTIPQPRVTVTDSIQVAYCRGNVHLEIHERLDAGVWLSIAWLLPVDVARSLGAALAQMADEHTIAPIPGDLAIES